VWKTFGGFAAKEIVKTFVDFIMSHCSL